MPAVDPWALAWFLPFTIPIAIWVSWSDMKFMKIPNKSVIALTAVYVVVGLLVFPLITWAWGFALAAGVLVIGFLLSTFRMIGAGDAKFAAAMAPFFIGADLRVVLTLFAACLLGALIGHRGLKRVNAFRKLTPDWLSWTHRDFPMGLALSGTLIFYPLLLLWFS